MGAQMYDAAKTIFGRVEAVILEYMSQVESECLEYHRGEFPDCAVCAAENPALHRWLHPDG